VSFGTRTSSGTYREISCIAKGTIPSFPIIFGRFYDLEQDDEKGLLYLARNGLEGVPKACDVDESDELRQ